jgi:phosphatidylserine/phosphatidylglycerophosphate/cardiolipin synthase-like enzyme
MNASPGFAQTFVKNLQSIKLAVSNTQKTSEPELPRYDASNGADVEVLVSKSHPVAFQLGTGASIYTTTLIPAILRAESEIILVTCFWAKSKTLSALGQALESLALARIPLIERGHSVPPLHVRICFSSRSLFQKLFHTTSQDGYEYPPASWANTLGLPPVELLEAGGIQLRVKTLFFLPFSVMHPKFVIIDRQRAFMPSCNVSWEAWLEGCVEIQGAAVSGLLDFFARTWKMDSDTFDPTCTGSSSPPHPTVTPPSAVISPAHYVHRFPSSLSDTPTMLLPSSHHRNPQFRPFPWQSMASPPATPLNVAVLQLIDESKHNIYMQTPNLTGEPVISAVLGALGRGVDVTMVTSRNMMLVEQLVTAGTTTSWCIRSLLRRYRSLCTEARWPAPKDSGGSYRLMGNPTHVDASDADLEGQHPRAGRLRICYFHPSQDSRSIVDGVDGSEEPVHSHLKLTIVDEAYTVLGSGNMDRASWYTSQELGILFESAEFASVVMSSVNRILKGRLDVVFDNRDA